jgi:hypothetical protein
MHTRWYLSVFLPSRNATFGDEVEEEAKRNPIHKGEVILVTLRCLQIKKLLHGPRNLLEGRELHVNEERG